MNTLDNLVVASGRAGGQTVVGGTQSGAELVLASSPNSDGLIEIGSAFFLDESGTVKKLGIFTFSPQNALDLPLDIRVRGAGTGTATFVNDVLQIAAAGGGGGGFFARDAARPAGFPAVLVPTTNTDALNVGPEAANFDAQMIVNVAPTYPASQGFMVVNSDSGPSPGQLLFSVAKGGGVGIGGSAPPASAIVDCNLPLQLHGTVSSPPINYGALTAPQLNPVPIGIIPVKQNDGSVGYLQVFAAASGGAAGVSDNFMGTDATNLATHTSDSGHTWTLVRGAWAIRGSNTGYVNNSGNSNALALCWISGQGADGTVICGLTSQSPSTYPYNSLQNGICLRYDATSDKCVVLIASDISHYQLREFDGGTPGTIFATLSVGPTIGDLLKVQMVGSTWNVWVASGTSGPFVQYVTNLTVTQSWASTGHHGLCNTWNNAFNQPEWFQYAYTP